MFFQWSAVYLLFWKSFVMFLFTIHAWFEGTTWEGGVRVPALFHWPGLIPPRKSMALFTSVDVLPTIMSIVGHPIDPKERLHGQDLSKTIFLPDKVCNH